MAIPDARALSSLDPDFAVRVYWLLRIARYYGVPVVITEARRTPERQRWLYASGRTRPGPILTNTLRSKHLEGRAVDLDIRGVRPDDVPQYVWDWLGSLGEWLGLTWGGRWRLRDYRHFEIR